MYIDCRYGQLHLTAAYPSSGGFDEASPLVFLHAEDGSGADFNRCAALLGADRSVYAPDLPGSGGSDAPKGRMAIAGLALAVVDLMEQLRLRRVDLIGCGRGAQVAFELAANRAQDVRRLIVAGTQQPTTGIPQPMLQLGSDPARILEDPADAVVAEIRNFLDLA
jgi:pimeloyl-ACP methyl ester carboxylesterase